MDSFSNTLNRFKSFNFATVRGAFVPRTSCGGRVIAFWWPIVPTRTKILPKPLGTLLRSAPLDATGRCNLPLPKSEKLLKKSGVFVPEYNSFRKEAEHQEIFSKKLWKSPFSKEILIKKSQKNSIKFFFPFGPNAHILQAGSWFLPVKWKSFFKSWWACNVLQIPVDFLKKIQEFSCNFQ